MQQLHLLRWWWHLVAESQVQTLSVLGLPPPRPQVAPRAVLPMECGAAWRRPQLHCEPQFSALPIGAVMVQTQDAVE